MAVTALTAALTALGWLQEILLMAQSPWMLLVAEKLEGSGSGLLCCGSLSTLQWLTALVWTVAAMATCPRTVTVLMLQTGWLLAQVLLLELQTQSQLPLPLLLAVTVKAVTAVTAVTAVMAVPAVTAVPAHFQTVEAPWGAPVA